MRFNLPSNRRRQRHIAGSHWDEYRPLRNNELPPATRTINSLAAIGVIARDVLETVRAGEFDVAHQKGGNEVPVTRRGTRGYSAAYARAINPANTIPRPAC